MVWRGPRTEPWDVLSVEIWQRRATGRDTSQGDWEGLASVIVIRKAGENRLRAGSVNSGESLMLLVARPGCRLRTSASQALHLGLSVIRCWSSAGSSLCRLLAPAFPVPLWFLLLLSANTQEIALPWAIYHQTSCIFFATWQGNPTSQIAHNPWLSCSLRSAKGSLQRQIMIFGTKRNIFWPKCRHIVYLHPSFPIPWGRMNSPGPESSFPPTMGWKWSYPWGCGKPPGFPRKGQKHQEQSFLSQWLCTQGRCGARGKAGRASTEKGLKALGGWWKERDWGRDAGWRRQALCLHHLECDLDLAPGLRSRSRQSLLLRLSFFHHNKDNTCHPELMSVHAFVLVFPTLFNLGAWPVRLEFESDTLAVPSRPAPAWSSWTPPVCMAPSSPR